MENSQEEKLNHTKKEGSIGAMIGSIIIIVIIIIGGLYFLGTIESKINNQKEAEYGQPEDQQVMELEAQSNSSEIDDIEKDLMDTNLDSLDEGFDQI